MKHFALVMFSVFGLLAYGPIAEAYGDGHEGDHHAAPPVFEDVDADSDGVISKEEAKAFFTKDPNISADEFKEKFGIVDVDGDGEISRKEWDADQARAPPCNFLQNTLHHQRP